MLTWMRSLFVRPLPEPWPTCADLEAAVIESLSTRPEEWRLTFNIWEWRFLWHRRSGVTVDPGGQVCAPHSLSWGSEEAAALFRAHPAILADKLAVAERAARRIHSTLCKLKELP